MIKRKKFNKKYEDLWRSKHPNALTGYDQDKDFRLSKEYLYDNWEWFNGQ